MASPSVTDPIVDNLISDFGGNYVFALDLLEEYRRDRRAVDKSWRVYFDALMGLPAEPDDYQPASAPVAARDAALTVAQPASPAVAQSALAAAKEKSKALLVPPML